MTQEHNNIELLIEELGKINNDPSNIEANMLFADTHAAQVAILLEELLKWRKNADQKKSCGGRVIVEGYDENSMEGAFADALNKASHFFSEHHDINITVLGLSSLPHGGHRATVEVDITPLTLRLTKHPDSLQTETKRHHEQEFKKDKKHEENYIKDMIYNHFLETTGQAPHVPDYFLINFTDADLLNQMIEKQFFKATHEDKIEPANEPSPPVPQQAMVRILRPDSEE